MEMNDLEDDLEILSRTGTRNEKRLRSIRELMKQITDSQHLKDSEPLPPPPLFPPVHPLINLKKSEDKRKLAQIENTIKKIPNVDSKPDILYSWDELNQQKNQLKELFVNAEKGIKDNQASMSRFYEVIRENIKCTPTLLSAIASSREDVEDYRSIERKLRYYVDKYSMFGEFLESVAETDDSWKTVADILAKYETLRKTSVECSRILRSELDEAAELRKRMLALLEQKSSEMKSLHNRLNLLEMQRRDSVARRNQWEHTIGKIKNAVSFRFEDSVTLNKGITDLYCIMCKELKVEPTIPSSDIRAQVDFIHKKILFYKEVVTIANGLKNPVVGKENVKRNKNLKFADEKIK